LRRRDRRSQRKTASLPSSELKRIELEKLLNLLLIVRRVRRSRERRSPGEARVGNAKRRMRMVSRMMRTAEQSPRGEVAATGVAAKVTKKNPRRREDWLRRGQQRSQANSRAVR